MRRPLFRQLSEQECEYYTERSFHNLIRFYSRELQQIAQGQMAYQILSKRERYILRKRGILILQGKGIIGRHLRLTEKAQHLLKNIRHS